MIYRLEVENFFSIRDQQVLDLTIAPNVPDPDSRFAPLFEGADLRAPKIIALYGANASGKTSILKALEFVVNIARSSASRTMPGFPCERFNDEGSMSRPMKFAVEFGGVMSLSPEIQARLQQGLEVEHGIYRYDLVIEVKDGVATKIESETLRQKPQGQGKWQRIFERDGEGKIKDSRWFSLSGYQHLLNTLRPNVSVLSSFALFQHPSAALWVSMIDKSLFQMGASQPNTDQQMIDYLKNQPDVVSQLNKELGRIDVGVEGMRFIEIPNGTLPMFRHAGLGVEMPWILESHGTRAFIKIFPAIAATLDTGGICAVDELDASIHPNILPEIMRWFYDKRGKNPLDAQLWFSCHSASLLDDLVKEEIVICEKDQRGRTSYHSLMDVKVRRDENHYRKYLSGAYGGIPQIG